jgi:hypothetical protein
MVTSARHVARTRRVAVVAALTLSLLAAACSDGGGASPTVPLPTNPPTTQPASTSSPAKTTTPTTSTTTLNPPPSITAPPTSVQTTATLPPVETLVPTVNPDLMTAAQRDPSDPNNSRLILPEHVPVLDAYLRAIQASTFVSSTWPINTDAPELVSAPLTSEALAAIQQAGRERLARGEVLNVSQGVTFRPYGVGPVSDHAVVMDCEIAGHYWMKAATGELIPPDEIWPAGPGHIVNVGLRVQMVMRDGQWLVDIAPIDPSACA